MKPTSALLLGTLALASLFAAACDDKTDAARDSKQDPKQAKSAATKPDAGKAADAKPEAEKGPPKPEAAPPKPEAAPTEAGGAGGDNKVGIPECDEYIEKYGKCIKDNAPPEIRPELDKVMSQTVEAWRVTANNGQAPARLSLQTTCKAAFTAVKKTSAGWGCTY